MIGHWSSSRLYVICDADACAGAGWSVVDFARACLDGGATLLQVRAKELPGGLFLDVAAAVVDVAREARALVIVNDRADVAAAAGAGGVHVGQEDLPPLAVRRLVGPSSVVGVSTHSDAQLRSALDQPIQYAAVGPVFGSTTKETGYEARGLEAVREAASITVPRQLPLVAIGGITLARAASVIAAGAQSVAVISDLLSTGRPAERVRAFLSALS
ncbi:MAG: thiamine phosphate synthase [Acidimicrobiia bacterium]|nr:thiamine phosphate synthase [Acidimicrobiia bacterium]